VRFFFKYIIVWFIISDSCVAQNATNKNIANDSLYLLIKNNPDVQINSSKDSIKLRLLVKLSEECETPDILKYAKPALELADKLLYNPSVTELDSKLKSVLNFKGLAFNNIGYFYDEDGDNSNALEFYTKGLKIMETLGNKQGVANSLYNIGGVYKNQGNIPKAIEFWSNSLKLQETIGDKTGIARSLNNLASIYKDQNDLPNAISFHERCLKIFDETGYKQGSAIVLNNIGDNYEQLNNYQKAMTFYERALVIQEKINDKGNMATTLNNIGLNYKHQKNIPKALFYYKKALELFKSVNDKEGVANTYDYLSVSYLNLVSDNSVNKNNKNLMTSLAYADSSLAISKKLGFPRNIRIAEGTISSVYTLMGNYKKAFEHFKQYIIYRDSLNNESTRKASTRNQLKYEFEKKEAVIKEQQEKERAIAKEKDRFQKIVIASVIIGLLLVIVFAAFIFKSLKTTRQQKHIIEEKQKEILDSIRYAKRIQTSLLPTEKYIENSLKKSINKK